MFLTIVLESDELALSLSTAKLQNILSLSLLETWWNFSHCYSLLFFMMLGITMVSAVPEQFQRLNYGVVFEPKTHIQMGVENWIHTFEVELPEELTLIQLSGCSKDRDTCKLVNKVLAQINQLRLETESMMNGTMETIRKLIPETQNLGMKSRKRRAIFSFLGEFAKTVMGTATTDDVNTLAKHVNALAKKTNKVLHSFEQHEEHVSSFIKTADERMTNLMTGIKENHLAINHISFQLQTSFKNLEQSFTTMNILLAQQVEKSQKLSITFTELLDGIYALTEGNLSPALIPPEIMLHSIENIQETLSRKYRNFHLLFKKPTDVYKHAQFIYARKASKLYISVKFLISPHRKPLSLFEVKTFAVPLNETSNHATKLLDLKTYFAVTTDLQYYITLENSDLNQCSQSKLQTCQESKELIPSTQSSCVLALFNNDKSLVKELCNFRVILHHISPSIVRLSQTDILVYNTNVLEFDCASGRKMEKGCAFCTIKVPCKCSVATAQTYLPPRLAACHANLNDTITKVHPVNLALLQNFFNDSKLQQINGNSLFQNPLQVNVPRFSIYNHTMSSIIADDRKSHLNLKKMAEVTKKDSMVFQSLSDSLLSGEISIEDDWPSQDDILLYVTMTTTGLCMVALVFTLVKLRKVLIILAVLQNARPIKAATLPSFHYKVITTATPKPLAFIDDLEIDMHHWIIALLIFILIVIVILSIIIVKKRSKSSKLILELTSGKHCVQITLKHLPLCPSYWNINLPDDIQAISIVGNFKPIVSLDWTDFTCTNKLNGQVFTIKSSFNISPVKAWKLKKVIHRTYCAYFYFQHNKFLIPLSNLTI